MSNRWIPTTERLPDQREFIESYVRSEYAAEFLVTIEGAVHSGNDRVAEKVMKHCIKTRKDIVIQQQAKPSKMQAASHIM